MRRELDGIVESAKASKTIRVVVQTRVKHQKYGKYISHRTVCHAHDELAIARRGDLVRIVESRPMSKLKRWQLVSVLKHSEE